MTGDERRGLTLGGARLRDALTTIQSAEAVNGPRDSIVFYGVADKDGGEVGVARLSQTGWSLEAAISAAVRDGRLDPGVRVTFRKRV
jgi:hypothetical protein